MHTPRSAASAAGITASAIYRAIRSGRPRACRLNGGGYAIYPGELLRAFPLVGQAAANAARQSARVFSFPAWRRKSRRKKAPRLGKKQDTKIWLAETGRANGASVPKRGGGLLHAARVQQPAFMARKRFALAYLSDVRIL
jgi:hypothetical protein